MNAIFSFVIYLKRLFDALLPYYSVVETNNYACHDALFLYNNYKTFTCAVLIKIGFGSYG